MGFCKRVFLNILKHNLRALHDRYNALFIIPFLRCFNKLEGIKLNETNFWKN